MDRLLGAAQTFSADRRRWEPGFTLSGAPFRLPLAQRRPP